MNLPDSLLKRLEENEKTIRKFREIETRILSILDFRNFFENLLSSISTIFGVPHVWISIIQESPITGHIKQMETSSRLKSAICFISHEDFTQITEDRMEPLLANRNIAGFSPLLPQNFDCNIGSIAVAPISLDGVIVGSLNQADMNIHRYSPDMDTDLLQNLALKISLCLSNVTAHERLKFMAYHDPLTGLLNRRVMEKILAREFERARRYQTDLSLVFMDLDKFKTINDTFGHDIGDEVLVYTAKALTKTQRKSDIVARFAGDEFVVILPSTDILACRLYIQRVTSFLKTNPLLINGKSIQVRISAGMASVLADEKIKTPREFLKKADERLYKAKAANN